MLTAITFCPESFQALAKFPAQAKYLDRHFCTAGIPISGPDPG